MVRCRACGLGFRDPRPGARELERRYRALRDELYVAEEVNRRRSLRREAGFEVLGDHLHLVYFSAGYVFHRLAQHAVPGARWLAAATRRLHLEGLALPLLLGEVTVVARRR